MSKEIFDARNDNLRLKLINILLEVNLEIKDDGDFTLTWYENGGELRTDIDRFIDKVVKRDADVLEEINLHFWVACTFQEHSMANGWSKKYMKLAGQFDRVYERLKNVK